MPNPDLPRGAVITVAGSNSEFGSKPRPAILLQSTALLDAARPLPICPVTSQASDAPLFRIQLPSDAETGLLVPSWAAIDGVQTIRRRRIGQHIGQIDHQTMLTIDRLLLVFLGLAGDDGGRATRRDSTGAFVKPTLRTTR